MTQAPHGGPFVLFAIGNFPMFLVAIAAGTVVSTLVVIALKRWVTKAAQHVVPQAAVLVA